GVNPGDVGTQPSCGSSARSSAHRSATCSPSRRDEGLCALEFTGPDERMTRLEARLSRHVPPHEIVDGESAVIAHARRWLAAYFAGESADLGGVRLDMRGAAFEKRVWQALTRIPPGETTSYGALAKALGSAGASRAVGAANGANPVSIIVP